MAELSNLTERDARDVLASAFGAKATKAPDRIRAGNKYAQVPAGTAVRAMLAFAEQQIKGLAPAGWKLVPIEATTEMRQAAIDALSGPTDFDPKASAWDALRAYSAIVAAAPHPTAIRTDRFECMIYDAHLPSMTARFRIPEGLPFASGIYEIRRIRRPTPDDIARWAHLPEPPNDDDQQEEQRDD